MNIERRMRLQRSSSGAADRPATRQSRINRIPEELPCQQAVRIFNKMVEKALGGDIACLRMVGDRLWPRPKSRPVKFMLPAIANAHDALAAFSAIFRAMGEGKLTPDEGNALAAVVERSLKVIELHDVVKRVEVLEQARDQANESKSPSAPRST